MNFNNIDNGKSFDFGKTSNNSFLLSNRSMAAKELPTTIAEGNGPPPYSAKPNRDEKPSQRFAIHIKSTHLR